MLHLNLDLSRFFCSIIFDNKIRNHAIFPGNLT